MCSWFFIQTNRTMSHGAMANNILLSPWCCPPLHLFIFVKVKYYKIMGGRQLYYDNGRLNKFSHPKVSLWFCRLFFSVFSLKLVSPIRDLSRTLVVTKLIPLYNLNTVVFILVWQKKILETIFNNERFWSRNKRMISLVPIVLISIEFLYY